MSLVSRLPRLAPSSRVAAAIAVSVLALGSEGAALAGAPAPPAWATMSADAKSAFARRSPDATVQRITRRGEPAISARRTAVDTVPTLFQDVAVQYEKRKFHEVEEQVMHLHYETSFGSWSFVGFQWGDVKVIRAGNYPPPPPAPTAQEITDAVKDAMREWSVRAEHIEKVQVAGKTEFTWLDDAPTASYEIPLKVSVLDKVNNGAVYGAQMKPRFTCEFRAVFTMDDSSAWAVSETIPDCATGNCSVNRLCKDSWTGAGPSVPGGGKKTGRKRKH